MQSLMVLVDSPSPTVHVWMHSYSSDIAGVVLMRFTNGCSNFLANLGSIGSNAPNYTTINKYFNGLREKYQFYDLNEHPVVRRTSQNLEKSWCK